MAFYMNNPKLKRTLFQAFKSAGTLIRQTITLFGDSFLLGDGLTDQGSRTFKGLEQGSFQFGIIHIE